VGWPVFLLAVVMVYVCCLKTRFFSRVWSRQCSIGYRTGVLDCCCCDKRPQGSTALAGLCLRRGLCLGLVFYPWPPTLSYPFRDGSGMTAGTNRQCLQAVYLMMSPAQLEAFQLSDIRASLPHDALHSSWGHQLGI